MNTSSVDDPLQEYTARHPHILSERLPPLLEGLTSGPRPEVLVDLGAGGGQVLWALRAQEWLGARTIAVDLSPGRIDAIREAMPEVETLVSDATAVSALGDGICDVAISCQVIEHLDDDRALGAEMARLLRPSGRFYVSSVIRGTRAWWVYRRGGMAVLDPTHVREYRSREDFRDALRHPALEIEAIVVSAMRFPLVDLVGRALAMGGIGSQEGLVNVLRERPRLATIRERVQVRPPGYSMIEAVGRRIEP